jgi:hypothetical protein
MTHSRRRWLHGERQRAARDRCVPAGFGISPNELARWFGVSLAAVNLIAALTSIEAYPFRALVIVGIDVLVIYGLAAYGHRARAASVTLGLKQNAEQPESARLAAIVCETPRLVC